MSRPPGALFFISNLAITTLEDLALVSTRLRVQGAWLSSKKQSVSLGIASGGNGDETGVWPCWLSQLSICAESCGWMVPSPMTTTPTSLPARAGAVKAKSAKAKTTADARGGRRIIGLAPLDQAGSRGAARGHGSRASLD